MTVSQAGSTAWDQGGPASILSCYPLRSAKCARPFEAPSQSRCSKLLPVFPWQKRSPLRCSVSDLVRLAHTCSLVFSHRRHLLITNRRMSPCFSIGSECVVNYKKPKDAAHEHLNPTAGLTKSNQEKPHPSSLT